MQLELKVGLQIHTCTNQTEAVVSMTSCDVMLPTTMSQQHTADDLTLPLPPSLSR
jgi:hypothetical protein